VPGGAFQSNLPGRRENSTLARVEEGREMKARKSGYAGAVFLFLLLGAGAGYFTTISQHLFSTIFAAQLAPTSETPSPAKNAGAEQVDPEKVTERVANFLRTLRPGGTAESAGHERNYVVSYQVDFFRKTPTAKAPEEGLSYAQLREQDMDRMPPYVYFGETVLGIFDPAQPGVVAVRATIDGKEVKGYLDSSKLWLEPVLDRPASDRYMAVTETSSVRVVPDPTSPAVLTILQGEVVDVVGQLNFQGRSWIKARFNAPERPRYGFIGGNEVQPLIFASVNQSAVAKEEVPRRIRSSKLTFSDAARQRLSQNGFYIEPIPPVSELYVDDMADLYSDSSVGEQIFVTTDIFLHSYHLIFDRMLQDIEEKKFLPAATSLSKALAKSTEDETKKASASAPAVHEALLCDLLYFSVGAKALDPSFVLPTAVRTQAEALVARINAGEGELPSAQNFLGFGKEDFTQYKVRGHYAKNAALQRYFRGMMWYGRHNFLLSDKTQTLAAILLPYLVDEAREGSRFDSMDGVVNYLIGRQDKYTLAGYRSVNRKVFGTEAPSINELTTNLDARLTAFQQAAWTDLPAPRIVSVRTGTGMTQEERIRATAGLKFLGQRYVLDAFIMNQLTSPSVGDNSNPRNLPSALDVMMLLSSKAASDLQQKEQKEHQWLNYDSQIAKLKGEAEAQLDKRSTFYEQFLYGLKTLFLPTSSKQLFALGEPWQYKNLNAGLASWTELKHDTILYAEQSAAEMGGGDEFQIPPFIPPGPKGYVEPNPAFFHQLTASIDQMMGSLKRTNFITDEYVDKFTRFRDLAHRAEEVSQKEVAGQPLTPDDYDWIKELRYSFDRSLLLPRGADEIKDPSLLQMALVADVATDAVSGRVLEEGVGTPQRVIVVAKDAFGGTRLAVGYVYSWYEFISNQRWNDAEWKKIIYAGGEKTRKLQGVTPPAWYSSFSKNAGGAP
jgi:hypothetical protein